GGVCVVVFLWGGGAGGGASVYRRKNDRRAVVAHSRGCVSRRCRRRTAGRPAGVATLSAEEQSVKFILPRTSGHRRSTTSSFLPALASAQWGAWWRENVLWRVCAWRSRNSRHGRSSNTNASATSRRPSSGTLRSPWSLALRV